MLVERSHRTDDEAFYLSCVLLLLSVVCVIVVICLVCYRWTGWRHFGVQVWVGCMITTTSVFIWVMGWRVGRRMSVVWRWDLRVRHM
jgi:hypothetical protein